MVRDGYYADALDAYLEIIAAHPKEGACVWRLLQHAAEAALDARAFTLSTELARAATAEHDTLLPGRTAPVVARAFAINAAALAGTGQTTEAQSSLAKAQQIIHNHRPTSRYVKWTAVSLAVASRPMSSTDDLIEVNVREIRRQDIRHLVDAEISTLYLDQAGMLCGRGMHKEAARLYGEAAKRTGVEPHVRPGAWQPFVTSDGRWQIPPEWHAWCRIWASAVAGLGSCLVHLGEQPDDHTRDSLFRALSLAVPLGLADVAVALALDLETLGTRDIPGRINPPAPMVKALNSADYHLFTFADVTTQQRWQAIYQRLASRKADQDGSDPADRDTTAPWPLSADRLSQLVEAGKASLALLNRLAKSRPSALDMPLSVAHATLRDLLAAIQVRRYEAQDVELAKAAVLELTAVVEGMAPDHRLNLSRWSTDSHPQAGFTPRVRKAFAHPSSETLERILTHAHGLATGRAVGTLDFLAAASAIDSADWTAFLVGAGVGLPAATKAEPVEGATAIAVGDQEILITGPLFESILRGEQLAASLDDESLQACHVVYGLLTDRRAAASQWLSSGGCSQHELITLLGSRVFATDLPTVDIGTGASSAMAPARESSSYKEDPGVSVPHSTSSRAISGSSGSQSTAGQSTCGTGSHVAEFTEELLRLVLPSPGRFRSWWRTRLVRWSPDGSFLATHDIAREGKTVLIWDISTGEEVRALRDDRKVYATSWSPDSTRLVTGISRVFQTGEGVRLWDTTTGTRLWSLDKGSEWMRKSGPYPVDWSDEPVSWSPDGSQLAVADSHAEFQPVVRILEARTGSVLRTIADARWAMWSPDDVRFATASRTRKVLVVWDEQTDTPVYTINDLADSVTSRWSPCGNLLAAFRRGAGDYVGIWDAATGTPLRALSKPVGSYQSSLSWSPDSSLLVVRHNRRLSAFEASTGDFVFDVGDVESIAWSPDSRRLATMHWKSRETVSAGEARIWDVATGSLEHTISDTLWLSWSPDGAHLAATGTDRRIRIWVTAQ
jgi:WD40 repeat protein